MKSLCEVGPATIAAALRLSAAGFLGAAGLLGGGLFSGVLLAAEALSPRQYEVTTDTGMPHLDENLRYARRTERQCLDLQDLSSAFWMLQDVSLQDCTLVKTHQSAEEAEYLLQCRGGHGTTGKASWQLGPGELRGALHVRLGAKNMTFYQRIIARPAGTCG